MALYGRYHYYELAAKVCSEVLEISNIIIISLCGKGYEHRLWSRGGGSGGRSPPPPLFGPGGGQAGAHHFELQALVCIVCSGKVLTLTQQCITQVTKTTNSQQDP